MLSRSSKTGVWILALLTMTLVAWTSLTGTHRWRHSPFGDFSYLQTGSECLISGCNPYDYTALNREAASRHELKPPIFPMVPVYPASTLIVLLPLAPLPWPLSAYVFNALAGLATALVCLFMACEFRIRIWDPAAIVMIAVLICIPISAALEFGNPALLASAMLTLACLLLLQTRFDTPGWLLVGLSLALKPQLAIGASAVLLFKRETRTAAARACALALTLLLVGLLAYRLRLGSFQFLASLRYALRLSALPGGSSDYANNESFDFLNLQIAFGAIPHISRLSVNTLTWLTATTLAGAACWIAFQTKALSRLPWMMIALATAISLLPVYHRGYDRVIALVLIPATIEIASVSKSLAWIYAAILTLWIANDTIMAHVLRRWHFAPQNPVEDVLFCCVLLFSLWRMPEIEP